MPTVALEVAEALLLIVDAIGFLAMAVDMFCVDRFAEDQIVPAETRDIIGRLNQKANRFRSEGEYGICGLRGSRYGPFILIGSLPLPLQLR